MGHRGRKKKDMLSKNLKIYPLAVRYSLKRRRVRGVVLED